MSEKLGGIPVIMLQADDAPNRLMVAGPFNGMYGIAVFSGESGASDMAWLKADEIARLVAFLPHDDAR